MAKVYSEERKKNVSNWVKKFWESYTPTDEYRRKMSDSARKANSLRTYSKKPIDELRSFSQIRRRVISERWNSCESCGRDKVNIHWTCPVQIHHIDWDSENNSPINLQVLCPNCHSLTNNYMNYWKKKSKWSINARTRKRYQNIMSTVANNHDNNL